MPTPTLTAERREDGKLIVALRASEHHVMAADFTHAELSEAVTRLQAVLTNAEAADLEDEQFAGES